MKLTIKCQQTVYYDKYIEVSDEEATKLIELFKDGRYKNEAELGLIISDYINTSDITDTDKLENFEVYRIRKRAIV